MWPNKSIGMLSGLVMLWIMNYNDLWSYSKKVYGKNRTEKSQMVLDLLLKDLYALMN